MRFEFAPEIAARAGEARAWYAGMGGTCDLNDPAVVILYGLWRGVEQRGDDHDRGVLRAVVRRNEPETLQKLLDDVIGALRSQMSELFSRKN